MAQVGEKSAFKKACIAAMLLLAILLGSNDRLQAQTLVVPGAMPMLYKEIPEYVLAKKRAHYQVRLPQGTVEFRGDGYYITSGINEFVILNQNPACLKRFNGKTVAVQGRVTEKVVPWNRLYFIVVDKINNQSYAGKVAPWMLREPTDEEICYWNVHKQLPPKTQKFMDYLSMPKSTNDSWLEDSDTLVCSAVTPESQRSVQPVESQLTAIQRQLTVIEQKVSKPPYRGIYSKPSEAWDATDWSLYMDVQGGG